MLRPQFLKIKDCSIPKRDPGGEARKERIDQEKLRELSGDYENESTLPCAAID